MSQNNQHDSRRTKHQKNDDFSVFAEDQEYFQRNLLKESSKAKKLVLARDFNPGQSKTHYCDIANISHQSSPSDKTVKFNSPSSSEKKLKDNSDIVEKNAGASSKNIHQLLEEKYKMQERPDKKSKYFLEPLPIERVFTESEESDNDLTDRSQSGESKDLVTEDDQPSHKHLKHSKIHDDIIQLQLSKTLISNMVDEKIRAIKKTESQLIQKEATKVEKASGSGDNGMSIHRVDSHIKKIQGLKAESIHKMEEELKRLKKLDDISDSYLKYLE